MRKLFCGVALVTGMTLSAIGLCGCTPPPPPPSPAPEIPETPGEPAEAGGEEQPATDDGSSNTTNL